MKNKSSLFIGISIPVFLAITFVIYQGVTAQQLIDCSRWGNCSVERSGDLIWVNYTYYRCNGGVVAGLSY